MVMYGASGFCDEVADDDNGSFATIECLAAHEPAVLHTQLPVVWASAQGSRVRTADGREWLDWTSGIFAANLGHAPPPVLEAIMNVVRAPLVHSYNFATSIRARAVHLLTDVTGFPWVVLTATGTEATEVAIKLCRSRAHMNGRARAIVVSFAGAFHGRTAGAQLAGGIPAQQHWTPSAAGEFVHLPYPVAPETRFDIGDLPADEVACVIIEPYQGSTMRAIDPVAARTIETWCRDHDVPLIVDEIQSGFGRTGALFAYAQLGISPDVLLVGKGMASGQPVAAALYKDPRLTAGIRPGELTTTHSGNPIALAAATATLEMFSCAGVLRQVPAIAQSLGAVLETLRTRYAQQIGFSACHGAVAGFEVLGVDGQPDAALARRLVERCAQGRLLVLTPVGPNGNLVKFAPPLNTQSADMEAGAAIVLAAAARELTA